MADQSSQRSSETELAAVVIEWLKTNEWEVYQEVQMFGGGGIADIVAVRDVGVKPTRIAWVVECKNSLSSDVIAQAHRWITFADKVSVAVPRSKRDKVVHPNWIVRHALQEYGIGLLRVSARSEYRSAHVEVYKVPRLHRHARRDRYHIIRFLHDEQKTLLAAGSCGGGYFTAFRRTVMRLEDYVREHPGCAMKEAIESIEHHYSNDMSARGSLAKWISEGKVKSLRITREGRRIKLYLSEVA